MLLQASGFCASRNMNGITPDSIFTLPDIVVTGEDSVGWIIVSRVGGTILIMDSQEAERTPRECIKYI